MRGMAFEVAAFQSSLEPHKLLKELTFGCNITNNNNNEPISVLDTRSPSPSTSTSTPSSSMGGGCTTTTPPMLTNTATGAHNGGPKDEWPELELPQQRLDVGLDDWERLLSETPAVSLANNPSSRWISGDFDDSSLSLQQLLQNNQTAPPTALFENLQNPNLLPPLPPQVQFRQHNLLKPPVSDLGHQKDLILNPGFEKHSILNPGFEKDLILNPGFKKDLILDPGLQKVSILNPGFKKDSILNPGFEKDSILDPGLQKVSILNQGHELLLKKPSQVVVVKQEPPQASAPPPHDHHQYQVICDQLFAAAELMLSGNRSHAQGILARLNHQFASGLTSSKPFLRAAFYFKEAMQMQSQSNLNPNRITAPVNGMLKMGAYKMLTEVSPIIQFMNFTSTQAILEALGDAKNIHIIDFDIGFGAQWASFIQELPINGADRGSCSLKITAFASPSTHHPLELGLMHENLSQLAQEIGIFFELEVVNFDSFDPRWFSVSENEVVAVNIPIWSASTRLSAIPSILHFVKQLSPRIVVSLDCGCERTDLPFPHYLLQGLQYYEVLLDSIDGGNVVSDTSNKIERYLFQSQIERMVSGKLQFPEPMPHWRSLFAAGGYAPVGFSKFAETQAECVLKRMQVQGFRLEKRQASLVLCWQNRELMTVSAWKC